MGGGEWDTHPRHKTTGTILSICGQTNIRVYNRLALCFPLPDGPDTRPDIDLRIRESLDLLARRRPEFAGRLELTPVQHQDNPKSGYICLHQSASYTIPYESHDLSSSFGFTYAELKTRGFPASAFVHPRFELPCDIREGGDLISVVRAKTLYLRGGMLLCLWVHHSLADGDGVRIFLDCLSAATRGQDELVGTPKSLQLKLDGYVHQITRMGDNKSFRDLIDECPEYGIHPELACPTGAIELTGGTPVAEIEKTGKIFVFSKSKLQELKQSTKEHVPPETLLSRYTCLAALTWAHIAQARLDVERYGPKMACTTRASQGHLMNPVNWKDRALKGATTDYYGNMVALAITKVPVSLLRGACQDIEQMAKVVREIRHAIGRIDDEFICRRLATYYAASDPRYLALDIDPRTQQDLGFNTWEHIGADTEWCLPGLGQAKPDVVRRMQSGWNMGGAVVLPSRHDSGEFQLLVTIPRVSMDRLCKDEGYMQWVDRVIE